MHAHLALRIRLKFRRRQGQCELLFLPLTSMSRCPLSLTTRLSAGYLVFGLRMQVTLISFVRLKIVVALVGAAVLRTKMAIILCGRMLTYVPRFLSLLSNRAVLSLYSARYTHIRLGLMAPLLCNSLTECRTVGATRAVWLVARLDRVCVSDCLVAMMLLELAVRLH